MPKAIKIFGVLFCLLGCGEFGDVGPQGTPCGDGFCVTGTYCADDGFGSCLNGCKSDMNCAFGESCATGSEAVGTCIPDEEEGSAQRFSDSRESCVSTCNELWELECMTDFDQVDNCRVWCQEAMESEVEAYALCVVPTDCYFENCF